MSDETVDLVWNKGIARLCDRRIPDEFPEGTAYVHVPAFAGARYSKDLPSDLIADPERHHDIREGEVVWVRLGWLRSFVRQVLPFVRARFVLATADSDSSVPAELGDEARAILDCPYVIRWFVQDYDGVGAPDRIGRIPVGIDYHMMAQQPIWGEGVNSPRRQEELLLKTRGRLPPFAERTPRAYLDFAWQKGRTLGVHAGARLPEHRDVIVERLCGRDAVFCQGAMLRQSEMWRRRGQFAAVLSPHGVGLDCHRTWEALVLGHLVIVPASSLDPLYAGLPVVAVEDWDEVTTGNLQRWLAAHVPTETLHEKFTSRYWVAEMRAAAANF